MTRSPYPIRRARSERRKLMSTTTVRLIVSNSPEDGPDRISRLEVTAIKLRYQPMNAAIMCQINQADSIHTTIFIHSTTGREPVAAATIIAPRAVAIGEIRITGWRRITTTSSSSGVRFSLTTAGEGNMIHPSSRSGGCISLSCWPEPDSGAVKKDPGHVGIVARTLNNGTSGVPVGAIWQTC
jgi:hypothetical protein